MIIKSYIIFLLFLWFLWVFFFTNWFKKFITFCDLFSIDLLFLFINFCVNWIEVPDHCHIHKEFFYEEVLLWVRSNYFPRLLTEESSQIIDSQIDIENYSNRKYQYTENEEWVKLAFNWVIILSYQANLFF